MGWTEPQAGALRSAAAPIRAAEYVRMSTEHQQYSLDYQACAIRRYAEERGFEIVRTYADAGRSGLSLDGRPALRRLLDDVGQRRADYGALLVYDVSRLGRFQDPDEAAAHELHCRRAGVAVHYCAEQFENDGTIGSALLKSLKRVMAGEYSRELSVKVYCGQSHIVRLGFWSNGVAGFGLRKMIVGKDRQPKFVLAPGEKKAIADDRIVLVPGPPGEIAVVREVYALFVDGGLNEDDIARLLNARGVASHFGRSWRRGTIRQLLTNEKYIGNLVWGRISSKLQQGFVRNHPSTWVRRDGAFQPIVDEGLFRRAQNKIAARASRPSDRQLLAILRRLWRKHGELNERLIDECASAPSASCYRERFGSTLDAFALIGYAPGRNIDFVEDYRRIRQVRSDLIGAIRSGIEERGGSARPDSTTGHLVVDDELALRVEVMRCGRRDGGPPRWRVRLERESRPRLYVLARMDAANGKMRDLYLLPDTEVRQGWLTLCERNGLLEEFRCDGLGPLFALVGRGRIGRCR